MTTTLTGVLTVGVSLGVPGRGEVRATLPAGPLWEARAVRSLPIAGGRAWDHPGADAGARATVAVPDRATMST